jgi:hypothetical protein
MIRKFISRARRLYVTPRKAKGAENWFVGGITDENKCDYTVDFSFLKKGRKYEAMIYEDGKMQTILIIRKAIIFIRKPLPVSLNQIQYGQKRRLCSKHSSEELTLAN